MMLNSMTAYCRLAKGIDVGTWDIAEIDGSSNALLHMVRFTKPLV